LRARGRSGRSFPLAWKALGGSGSTATAGDAFGGEILERAVVELSEDNVGIDDRLIYRFAYAFRLNLYFGGFAVAGVETNSLCRCESVGVIESRQKIGAMRLKDANEYALRSGPKLVQTGAAMLLPRLAADPIDALVILAAQTPGVEVEVNLPSDLNWYRNDDRAEDFPHIPTA